MYILRGKKHGGWITIQKTRKLSSISIPKGKTKGWKYMVIHIPKKR